MAEITKRDILQSVSLALLLAATWGAPVASAHVEVVPDEVGVGVHDQEFRVVVPGEKEVPTVAVRLAVPGDLEDVTPKTKPGWQISVKKDGEGDRVTEIEWSGGQIPDGQFDDFAFTAQPPAGATVLTWKAYQTYGDGTVVSWDKEGAGSEEGGPASQTRVIDDLSASVPTESRPASPWLSVVTLLVSLVSLAVSLRRR